MSSTSFNLVHPITPPNLSSQHTAGSPSTPTLSPFSLYANPVLYETSVLLARMFHYSSLLRIGIHLFPGTPWLTFPGWQTGRTLGRSSIAPARWACRVHLLIYLGSPSNRGRGEDAEEEGSPAQPTSCSCTHTKNPLPGSHIWLWICADTETKAGVFCRKQLIFVTYSQNTLSSIMNCSSSKDAPPSP